MKVSEIHMLMDIVIAWILDEMNAPWWIFILVLISEYIYIEERWKQNVHRKHSDR